MAKKNVEELTYKEASTELELIIRNLESGEMELEESLESYTRGVELLRSLRTRLEDAEQKVSVLMKDVDGSDVLQIGMFAALIDHTRRKNERQKHRGYQYYRNRYTRFSSLHNDSPHAIITCKFLRYISYATLF